MLLPPHLAIQGFPQDIWNKYSGGSMALHGGGQRCQGCAQCQHHCCSQSLSETTLVNDCIKGRRKKGCWEDYFIPEHMQMIVCQLHPWE